MEVAITETNVVVQGPRIVTRVSFIDKSLKIICINHYDFFILKQFVAYALYVVIHGKYIFQ